MSNRDTSSSFRRYYTEQILLRGSHSWFFATCTRIATVITLEIPTAVKSCLMCTFPFSDKPANITCMNYILLHRLYFMDCISSSHARFFHAVIFSLKVAKFRHDTCAKTHITIFVDLHRERRLTKELMLNGPQLACLTLGIKQTVCCCAACSGFREGHPAQENRHRLGVLGLVMGWTFLSPDST